MHPMDRRRFLKTSLAFTSMASVGPLVLPPVFAVEQDFKFEPDRPIIPAPTEPSAWPEFRHQLAAWREQKCRDLHYSAELYQREDFHWVPSSFACCFLMLCDETFYNPNTGR